MSFEQVFFYQLTKTSRNVPKRTRTDRNGQKRAYKTTETDFSRYRNGLYSVPKRTLQCTETEQNVVSSHKETNTFDTRKDRPGKDRKQMHVYGGGRYVGR